MRYVRNQNNNNTIKQICKHVIIDFFVDLFCGNKSSSQKNNM